MAKAILTVFCRYRFVFLYGNRIYPIHLIILSQYNDGKAMTGAAEVLAAVKATGLQTLVVTGSGQHSLINKLEHTYPGCFTREKMVTAFDVKYGKPHPEPYLMGLQKAGVHANEAFVVENAPMGVEAGVAAGIFTIAVNTGPLPDKVLLDAGADLLYPDIIALPSLYLLKSVAFSSYSSRFSSSVASR